MNIGDYFGQHLATLDKVLYRHFSAGAWRDVTVGELAALVGRWQLAFRSLGLGQGERVGVCLKNDVDWIALDLAALGLGLVVVPLYADDNPDNVAWCLINAETRLVVVESSRMARALAQTGASPPPVYVLRPDEEDHSLTVAALLPPEAVLPEFRALSGDTLATICYTSGTAGRSKGVMLSHANIIANVESCRKTGMAHAADTFLSILPLSHMFERTGGYYLPLAIGAKVVFARGVAQLADDLASQAPTIMFAVPRIFEKFLSRIDESLARSPSKRRLFEQCATRRGAPPGSMR